MFVNICLLITIFPFLMVKTSDEQSPLLERTCLDHRDCGSDALFLCIDKQCHCMPNYYWNGTNCQDYICKTHQDCREYDKNRVCLTNGTCHCKDMYKEQALSQLCGATIPLCSDKNDCQLGKFSLCADKTCICEPNYRYDEGTKTCAHFLCQTDLECQQNDYNRVCQQNKVCECKNGFNQDDTNKTCLLIDTKSFKEKYFWIIVGTLSVLLVLVTCCCCRGSKFRIICAKKW